MIDRYTFGGSLPCAPNRYSQLRKDCEGLRSILDFLVIRELWGSNSSQDLEQIARDRVRTMEILEQKEAQLQVEESTL